MQWMIFNEHYTIYNFVFSCFPVAFDFNVMHQLVLLKPLNQTS